MSAIVGRSRSEAVLAVAAAWVAFMTGLLAGGEVQDAASFAVAGLVGAAFVLLGFAAASRCRTLSRTAPTRRARLIVLSLALGTALGLANLAANWAIAEAHPTLRALLVERTETLEPRVGLIAAPAVEEVAMRLFLMSAIAWVVSHFTKSATLVFAIAMAGSAFVFALLHLDRPLPADPVLANYYRAALLTKYTLAGVPLGWIFWRWGLPYAILCHVAANAAHLALQERLF
jgi:membrane protease YdiL (CAAX protease family)